MDVQQLSALTKAGNNKKQNAIINNIFVLGVAIVLLDQLFQLIILVNTA